GLRTQVERIIRENRPQGAAAALRGMALRSDSSDILARFGGPALVLVGAHDEMTPLGDAQRVSSLISGSKLVGVPDAVHLSNMENPKAFNAALESFFELKAGR